MSIKIIVIIACIAVAVLAIAFIIHHHRRGLLMDSLEGHEFEAYCAELLEDNGFSSVEVTPASRDFGIDILAEKDGVTYAIQCKRYQSAVGIEAVQQAYAGRDFYDRMVGVVMTNQYITAPATQMADKLHILLWDRGYIEEMEE